MSTPGIVLVHGFLGSPADLTPLADVLAARYGSGAIERVCLPGHGAGRRGPVAFQAEAFLATIAAASERQRAQGRELVLVGHSTGGNLILEALDEAKKIDRSHLLLAVLLAAPPAIDGSYFERWNAFASGGEARLGDVAALVSLVNRRTRRPESAAPVPSPVLVVQGEADALVLPSEAPRWLDGRLRAPARLLRVERAGHRLFDDSASIAMVVDSVGRAIEDALLSAQAEADATDAGLADAAGFFARWPHARPHVLGSPAGLALRKRPFAPAPVASTEPSIANIEITTRCNLACLACARAQPCPKPRDMTRAQLECILERLPHAFRIVVVGLGEPSLHPELADFVRIASGQGRRVALVSNGMELGTQLAGDLCDAGLASMTFSLDAAEPEVAARVRRGSDLRRIVENIQGFLAQRARRHDGTGLGKPAVSIFTALSSETALQLQPIVQLAADLGIDAVMVSDLNFIANQGTTLHASLSPAASQSIRQAVKTAAARRLPLLSVHGLEMLDIRAGARDVLLFRAEQIASRSRRRAHCASPWQTAVVSVDGDLSICDCQPHALLGNILEKPLSACWNSPDMVDYRKRMLGDCPPADCLACPRF